MSDGSIITEEKEEIDLNEKIETFKDDFKNSQEEFIKMAYEKIEKAR